MHGPAPARLASEAPAHLRVPHVRRRPEKTVLYQIIREHAETLFAEARSRSESGAGYPRYVQEEFRRYLTCGVLGYGFARIVCEDCHAEELLAFSCKARALCPSCIGRRMTDTAARLADEGLPIAPYRQWTLSFPWKLRLELAKDPQLLSRVFRICMRKVFAWQRKRARSLSITGGKSLGVAFVQRFGSLLQLNIHGHSIVADGVFVDDGQGGLVFRPLPAPTDEEVMWVTRAIAKAVIKLVKTWEPSEDDEEMSALWQKTSKTPTVPKPQGEPEPVGRRRAQVKSPLGTFSVHADTAADAEDRAGLERMLRYAQRPAFAQKRLSLLPSGQVRYRLRRAYYTGQREIVLEPVAFLRRLAQLIPPPRQNQIRFYGLLASQAHDRPKLEALLPSASTRVPGEADTANEAEPEDTADVRQRTKRYRIGWAKLLARVFDSDVKTCPRCGGERAVRAWVTKRASIERLLGHWDLSADLPITEPARAPPQTELFSSA